MKLQTLSRISDICFAALECQYLQANGLQMTETTNNKDQRQTSAEHRKIMRFRWQQFEPRLKGLAVISEPLQVLVYKPPDTI